MLSEQERKDLIKKLQGEVLELFNERLIKNGINDAAEAIGIASVAMAQAAAVLMWSQMPEPALRDKKMLKEVIEDWCKLYVNYVQDIVNRRLNEAGGGPISAHTNSELANLPETDEEDTDVEAGSAWAKGRRIH